MDEGPIAERALRLVQAWEVSYRLRTFGPLIEVSFKETKGEGQILQNFVILSFGYKFLV